MIHDHNDRASYDDHQHYAYNEQKISQRIPIIKYRIHSAVIQPDLPDKAIKKPLL
jgi:hypothetical protein